MEFDFAVTGLQGDDITVWDAGSLVHLNSVEFHKLRNLLEVFGQRSATAQGLRAPITDIWRLRSSDQRLYLHTGAAGSTSTTVLGGLKVGKKKLFIHRANGATVEIEPLCVLDFYVHESCQRQGVGRAVFEHMLQAEQLTAEQLAYDRPSPKLLSFLHKHYGLASYIPQSNNFVVFEAYFQHHSVGPGGSHRLTRAASSGSNRTAVTSASMGTLHTGRQNVHVLGSAAAAGQNVTESWVPTSVRPPTASLQQSIQLQPAADSNSWQARGTAAVTTTLGGPGCPAAGIPTDRQQTRYGHLYSGTTTQKPSVQQQQTSISYTRGSGYKALDRGQTGREPNTFKGYEQALMAPAVNPAPAVGLGTVRDSLDQFSSMYGINANASSSDHVSGSSTHRQLQGGTGYSGVGDYDYAQAVGSGGASSSRGGFTCSSRPAEKYPLTPYGGWEPQPGVTLCAGSEAERMSLRRQHEQLQQQQQQSHIAKWEAAGAGPPGHLLASPTNGYAVPTAGMAEVLNRSQQQHVDAQVVAPSSNIISWNGLPVPGVSRSLQQQGVSMQSQQQPQQQQQQYHRSTNSRQYDSQGACSVSQQFWYRQHPPQQPGEVSSSTARSEYSGHSSRADSGGGVGLGGLDYGSAKAAAAVFRAGSGAASCLRMT